MSWKVETVFVCAVTGVMVGPLNTTAKKIIKENIR